MAKQTNLSPFFKLILRIFIGLAIVAAVGVMLFPNYFKQKRYQSKYNSNNAYDKNYDNNNKSTPLNSTDKQFIKQDEVWLPAHNAQDKQLIRHQYYTLLYSEEHEQPIWVAYKLEASQTKGNNRRQDNFRPDPSVPTRSANPADYKGSGYSRGHLAPVGDFKFSAEAMSETFYMSNMSPQAYDFNGGIWNDLEQQVRYWINRDKEFYIVSGPVLEKGLPKIGKQTKVSVPNYYYKIIIDPQEPQVKAIAFLMKNEPSREPLEKFVISINDLETKTGLDFFPQLPDELEEKLESEVNSTQWFTKKSRRRN